MSKNTSEEMSCLVLIVQKDGRTYLSVADENQNEASLCSRIANVTAVTQQPEFLEIIRELTVDTKTTKMAMRKLSSADDNRTSAKTLGGSAGVILVGIVIGFIVLLDIPWQTISHCTTNR